MSGVEHIFMYLLAICRSSLEKCLFKPFTHFLIRLFSQCWFAWAACIFLKIILCQLSHLLLSSPILRVVFHLVYSFLCHTKAFRLNYVPLFLCFYFHYSRRWVIEDFAMIYVIEGLCMFYPKRFIVLVLTFRSLIHFWFIFMYGVRKGSHFIFLHVAVQFSQQHSLKRQSLTHSIFLPPCQK